MADAPLSKKAKLILLAVVTTVVLATGMVMGFLLADASSEGPPTLPSARPSTNVQPTVAPDKSMEGKEVTLRELLAKGPKLEDVKVVVKGQIVQLSDQPGQFLRDQESYTIKLDLRGFQGDLNQFQGRLVKITGKYRPSRPGSDSGSQFVVTDVERAS